MRKAEAAIVGGRIARINVRPLWAASGALSVVLFGCGLVFGDLLASSNYPPLNASHARLSAYFLHNGGDVRALALFHLLSALALLAFAAYLYTWLGSVEHPAPLLRGIALAGGATAATFLLLSALLYRALAEPAVASDPGLAHALVVLSYLAGGPAVAVPLALPIGAVAIVALRSPTGLPRWSGPLGLAAMAASLASAVTLLGPMNNSSALYGLLLLAAILAFGWLLLTSVIMASQIEPPVTQPPVGDAACSRPQGERCARAPRSASAPRSHPPAENHA